MTEPSPTSFDPKTWISPETPRPSSDAAPLSEGAKSKPIWLWGTAAACAAILGLGATMLTDQPAPDGEAARVPSVPLSEKSGSPASDTPPASIRIISISGASQLTDALIEMGVPADRAVTDAREAILALGTEEEIRVAVELIESAKPQSNTLSAIKAELPDGTTVRLTRAADKTFARENVRIAGASRVVSAEGTINRPTFYAAAIDAGIPNSLISTFAKAISFDFDFQQEVKQGDRFRAAWQETVSGSGRSVTPPRLLFIEMESAGKLRRYYAFTPPDSIETQWFDESGQGAARALMRTPVDGARVTSQYGVRRHPITFQRKKHNGIDFAAPTGTPVYASGDATVIHRAMSGGAGNLIKLDHGDGMQTWYMHLNGFADGLQVGGQVKQGDIIGYVGSTGGSTGPHLHYEIRINLDPVNPLTFETTENTALDGTALRMFQTRRDETRKAMRSNS